MNRLVGLVFFAACSTSNSAPNPAPAPPVVAAKPVLHSTLEASEALTYLPPALHAVVIASSYQQADAVFGISALSILPPLPPGVSKTKPIGLAWWRDDLATPIAFGYVDDEKALRAAMPNVEIRGPIAFFGGRMAAITLEEVEATAAKQDRIASDAKFAKSVASLHGGALVSWWIENAGAVGIDGDATKLHIAADSFAVPLHYHDEPELRASEAKERAAHLDATERKKLEAARLAADAAHAKLDAARGPAIADAAKALGLEADGKLPVDATFAPPGGVKAWTLKVATAWQAPELARAVSEADKSFEANASREVAREIARQQDQAQRFADLLTGDAPSNTTAGDMATRKARGSLGDLGSQIADVRDGGKNVAVGGGSRGGGDARVGTGVGGGARSPRVTLAAGGDAALHGFLAQRLARVQHCFDDESGHRVSVAITTDASGLITAKATGDAATCVELAVRGTSTAVNASGTFTFEAAP